MNLEVIQKKDPQFVVHYSLSFKHVCLLTVSCPLLALVICFVTAYIFQANDIHETHCRVYNIIPSISAITGISPQRYLWRISIAFHIGPRIIISAVSRAYHLNLINKKAQQGARIKAHLWLNIAFWLNVIETGSLCGVTYISNRENYPVHEKLFITFMVSSLSHMLACIKAVKSVDETGDMNYPRKGLQLKQILFNVSLICTIGLVAFFLEHRLLCHRMVTMTAFSQAIQDLDDVANEFSSAVCCIYFLFSEVIVAMVKYHMAFSMFALCEYIIALANMAFHITVILDFPTEHFLVAKNMATESTQTKSCEKME